MHKVKGLEGGLQLQDVAEPCSPNPVGYFMCASWFGVHYFSHVAAQVVWGTWLKVFGGLGSRCLGDLAQVVWGLG